MGSRFNGARVARAILASGALLVLAASAALAQGFYYKEIRKDERVYVFNNAANAERFEKSGDMGVGITRPGAGPNGETVVADSERALQLFFFKHNISEPVPEPPAPVQRIEWRDGKTRITTDNAYLEISNRVQVRFTEEFPDDNTKLPGTDNAGDPRGSFRIRRAKFKLEGWFWKPWLTYELQTNWPGVTGSNTGAMLEDAALDVDLTKGKGFFRLHVGQFKVPFGAQELTSSGSQAFVDRSVISNEFFRGRDTGAAVWGTFGSNRFEYRLGMFNGNGLTRPVNDNAGFQYNARFLWQPNGSQPLNQRAWVTGALYSEGDFESTGTPIYALALNFERGDFNNSTVIPALTNYRSSVVSVDGIFKYKGFFVSSFYNWGRRTYRDDTKPDFDTDGYMVQLTKMLDRARTWEAGVRFSEFDLTHIVTDDERQEIRGVVSYYYRRHNLKLQTDFGQFSLGQGPGKPELKTFEVRSQLQFIF